MPRYLITSKGLKKVVVGETFKSTVERYLGTPCQEFQNYGDTINFTTSLTDGELIQVSKLIDSPYDFPPHPHPHLTDC